MRFRPKLSKIATTNHNCIQFKGNIVCLLSNCVWNSRAKRFEPNQIMEILPANHCYSSSQWKFSSWQAWLLWTRSNQLVLFPFLGPGVPIWTSRWHLIWLLQEFAHSRIIIWVGWQWNVYIVFQKPACVQFFAIGCLWFPNREPGPLAQHWLSKSIESILYVFCICWLG